jgi:hypothetical protein
MNVRPILFSAPMVRALLEGRKTQTRRVMKTQPTYVDDGGRTGAVIGKYAGHVGSLCPYGWIGDLLWVRETFASSGDEVVFAADCSDAELAEEKKIRREFPGISDEYPGGRWRPSIHMPRAASRLTLRITEVRVEQLQYISEADAIAEGIDGALCAEFTTRSPSRFHCLPASVHAFFGLWESINGKGSCAPNPWVWAISFDVIKANVYHVLKQVAA